ncbi:Cilia- and flagella-associated protein 206 [Trypanosoma melophagium]|uniref:Cilia- and flagella-associated protein 206 n=1 Tax=Trypanosoma melophagium TaxID=715481 RepID=UPI003519FBD4|nr:Cilia- and flagella-associated protein 206 [Trypanosoma melophagium]
MNVTPVLAKEIVKRFRKQTGGTSTSTLTPEFAAFAVRLSLLGSTNKDEKGNVAETPEAIEAMAENLSKYFATCSTNVMATLSLQCQTAGLRANFMNKRRTEQVKQEAVTMRLMGSLCENSTRMPEEMLSEIAFFILHRYGQLRSTSEGDVTVRKETVATLNGVLPRAQVRAFANQPAEEKRRQLEELRRIVWGIRLYNMEEGRTTGAGLIVLHDTAASTLSELQERITQELQKASAVCSDYVAFLRSPSAAVGSTERQALREEYHRALQLLLNLRIAEKRLADLANIIHGEHLRAYDTALAELRAVLGTTSMRSDGVTLHSSVPKRTVYPKFIALADAYEETVQSFETFGEIRALVDLSLSLGTVSSPSLPPTLLEQALAGAKGETATDHDATAAYITSLHASPNALSYIANSAELKQHLASRALHGLCPVCLVEDGICVEGKESEEEKAFAGFLVQPGEDGSKGKWYAFCSDTALRRFAASPTKYLDTILHMAEEDMVLVGLLDMYDQLPRELYIRGTRKYEPRVSALTAAGGVVKRHDMSTQTGQIDPYMDHNYRWNEWDLRRQALKLVNLLNMRTHSTQTIASHFRRDNATQVRPPRDDETQTMQNAAVQPPRTVQYLKGLRGTKTSAIETVQKTFLY